MTKAFSLSLAALLGEDVYNFGELVRCHAVFVCTCVCARMCVRVFEYDVHG